jgi:hypothetical protein
MALVRSLGMEPHDGGSGGPACPCRGLRSGPSHEQRRVGRGGGPKLSVGRRCRWWREHSAKHERRASTHHHSHSPTKSPRSHGPTYWVIGWGWRFVPLSVGPGIDRNTGGTDHG